MSFEQHLAIYPLGQPQVLLLNRASERAAEAAKGVAAVAAGTVTSVDCDLMSLASVERAAEQVKSLLSEARQGLRPQERA